MGAAVPCVSTVRDGANGMQPLTREAKPQTELSRRRVSPQLTFFSE
jgi:hypothetical protein